MKDAVSLLIAEMSQVGEARRAALSLAGRLGFDTSESGRAAIVITEMTRNIIQHAGSGELLLRPVSRAGHTGLEALALDNGPGMANVERCLGDGYSTAGTPGTGLGAVTRLADEFDIYSAPGLGTAMLAHLYDTRKPAAVPDPKSLEVGVVSLPHHGDDPNGDAWAGHFRDSRSLLMVADGLGHGPEAATAAREAVRVFEENTHRGPADILHAAHAAMRHTRGAALAVAEMDRQARQVRYAGVGNIAGLIASGDSVRNMISYNGTVGHTIHKVQEFTYPIPPDALLVMHSDGLSQKWDMDHYPGLMVRRPALIAGVLYRDFRRERDDVTVLVARETPA